MNNDQQKNILVTGASGLLGSHLVKLLVQQGRNVTAIYRNSIPVFECADKIKWIQGDILDVVSLEEALENIQLVYHCAGYVSFNPNEKELLYKINVEGTANVVNACIEAGVDKLVHVSSVSALGRIREHGPVSEKMNWTPETSNSEYGRTKYLAEMEVWRGVGEGLDAVAVNPTIILGASDWSKGSTALFKNVYNEFPWYTEGVTGFVDALDVARAMILLAENETEPERYIISAENITYKNLFNLIAKGFQKKEPSKKVTPFVAASVWRLEKIKSFFTGKSPLITKETSRTARAKVYFDNGKLLKKFPDFHYTPMEETVQRICNELKEKYKLK